MVLDDDKAPLSFFLLPIKDNNAHPAPLLLTTKASVKVENTSVWSFDPCSEVKEMEILEQKWMLRYAWLMKKYCQIKGTHNKAKKQSIYYTNRLTAINDLSDIGPNNQD